MSPLLLSGAFLGWGLGANDSANVFGTAVYTKVVRYRSAILLTALFVVIGAWVNGGKGIENISHFSYESGVTTGLGAFFVMFSAGITVAGMTFLKLPVSTSQAVIGGILGAGIMKGTADFSAALPFFSAWVLTPIGSMLISMMLMVMVSRLEDKLTHFRFYEAFIRVGYILSGILGAYSLGANNVANVMGIYSGKLGLVDGKTAAILGGASIALGVLTFSKPVMSTVGEGIAPLSAIAGFMVVLATSITVYVYALIGIPVSSSQAVVGAVIGVGLIHGARTIRLKVLGNIFAAWIGTPLVAGIISLLLTLLI